MNNQNSQEIWKFTKMHGAGNDFVVLDAINQLILMTPERARILADRNFGIGADQILLVQVSETPDADFRYRIFNSDGNEVEHCGNGARCFARFIYDQGLSEKNPLNVEIQSGIFTLKEDQEKRIIVDMGKISFEPKSLPFESNGLHAEMQVGEKLWNLDFGIPTLDIMRFSVLSISNPHAVVVVKDLDEINIQKLGSAIQQHPRFPNQVNVGFMEIKNRQKIFLRVYERGVGETLSCGTGACAAAVSGIRRGLLNSPVEVCMKGGILSVIWNESLYMTGPVFSVFEGSVKINNLLKNSRPSIFSRSNDCSFISNN